MIFFVAFLKLVAIVLAYANYVYYAKFQDNALVVGRTNCGKTYFVQKLVVNNFFLKVNFQLNGYLKLLSAKQERLKFNLVLTA